MVVFKGIYVELFVICVAVRTSCECAAYTTEKGGKLAEGAALPNVKINMFNYYDDVFSEEDIFRKSGTNETVPLIYKNHVAQKLFKWPKRIYGYLPCACGSSSCSCCADIKIRTLRIFENGCVVLSVPNGSSSLRTGITLNNKTVVQERLNFENSPPLCAAFPPFPVISVCARLTSIKREGKNVKACVDLELRLTGTLTPLWVLHFTCLKIGLDGVQFAKPSQEMTTTTTTEKSTEKPNETEEQKPSETEEQKPMKGDGQGLQALQQNNVPFILIPVPLHQFRPYPYYNYQWRT